MKLYAVRHGETEWNRQEKVCGRTDIPLTVRGIEQAEETGKALAGKGIDVMIVSPMLRARMTADIIKKYVKIDYIVDERLIEQNYGKYEGIQRNDSEYAKVKSQFAYTLEGGESPFDLCHRVYGFVDDVKRRYGDKNVLLVCHGGVCRMIHTYFYSLTNDEYPNFRLKNCEIREYEM